MLKAQSGGNRPQINSDEKDWVDENVSRYPVHQTINVYPRSSACASTAGTGVV
jgi:hypothetical protein